MRVRRLITSLSGRIVVVTLAVSLITLVVTAVVAIGVIQRNNVQEARQLLRTQTRVLSGRPEDTIRVLMRETQRLSGNSSRFALLTPDGRVLGEARPDVTPRLAARLQKGRSISTSEQINGQNVVVEGEPRRGGGAIVGIRRVSDIRASSAVVSRWIMIALAAGLAAAVIAAILLARLIGRPLERVARAARRLAGGERGVPIQRTGVSEVEDIATALRTLDDALAASEDRQRDFLLSVSHEIRTPLTAIRGYAEALADGMVASADLPTVGRTLGTEAERLTRFVGDLLELARMEADDFAIREEPVDLAAIVMDAVRAWSGVCSQLGILLRSEIPSLPLPTLGDSMRLRQIVDGLIENAVRVTPEGRPVVVAGYAAASGMVLEVRDGGPGLSPEDESVAFDRGVLHDRYRGSRPVGTGLGLSIARRLVTRMGGLISAGQAAEGGASFRVVLPLRNPNSVKTGSEPS